VTVRSTTDHGTPGGAAATAAARVCGQGAAVQLFPDGLQDVLQAHRLVGIQGAGSGQFGEPEADLRQQPGAGGIRVLGAIGDVIDVGIGQRPRHSDSTKTLANSSRSVKAPLHIGQTRAPRVLRNSALRGRVTSMKFLMCPAHNQPEAQP
jgi:hypothetical protein